MSSSVMPSLESSNVFKESKIRGGSTTQQGDCKRQHKARERIVKHDFRTKCAASIREPGTTAFFFLTCHAAPPTSLVCTATKLPVSFNF